MSADEQSSTQSNDTSRRSDRQPPKNKGRSGQVSGAQIMFAGVLAVGMILGISLSSRVASSQPLREGLGEIRDEISQLEMEYAQLLEDRDFALSDAYVEQWARGEGKMVRNGEILVIPVPVQGQNQPLVEDSLNFFEPETTEPEPEPWELWWSLFFDGSPPEF